MALGYFNAYFSYLESIEPLDDAERGRLFTALLEYASTGALPDLSGNERFIFPSMRAQIDRDVEKYIKKCERNKRTANKRWEDTNAYECMQTHTNAYERIQTDANDAKEKDKDKEKEKEKEKDKDKDKDIDCKHKTRSARFVPPTLEEVTAYVAERNSQVDPQGFIDFYSSKGWMVGKTKMTDWKAACRNAESWERWSRNTAKDLSYMDAWANGESVAVDFIDEEETPF